MALHNLLTAAALTGRLATIPELPCAFFKSLSPSAGTNLYRLGISLPDVLVSGSADEPRCYLYQGGASCELTDVMQPFDFERFAAASPLPAPLPLDVTAADSAPPLDLLRSLCVAASKLRTVPVLTLTPPRMRLLDAAVALGGLHSNASPSALTSELDRGGHLSQLRRHCPGTGGPRRTLGPPTWRGARTWCESYFLDSASLQRATRLDALRRE